MTFPTRAVWMVGVVLLTAPALAQSPDPAQALAHLRAKHPGVRILEHTGPELALESSRRISGVLRAVLIPRITHSRSQRALTAIGRPVIMHGNRRT